MWKQFPHGKAIQCGIPLQNKCVNCVPNRSQLPTQINPCSGFQFRVDKMNNSQFVGLLPGYCFSRRGANVRDLTMHVVTVSTSLIAPAADHSGVTRNLGAPRQNIKLGPLGLSFHLKTASGLTRLGQKQYWDQHN